MGQKLGTAIFSSATNQFSGLSKSTIGKIWQDFNDIADGFGITREELYEIFSDSYLEINVSKETMRDITFALFTVFDTDENDLVDALEVCCTISVLSAMRFEEIINFILHAYDFDGKSLLSVDEVILCLKSVGQGLCKISLNEYFPEDIALENLVLTMFFDEIKQEVKDNTKLNVGTLVQLLTSHPDIRSWNTYFSHKKANNNIISSYVDSKDQFGFVTNDDFFWNVGKIKKTVIEQSNNLVPHVDPWLKSVSLLAPTKYSSINKSSMSPNITLELEWVYGYQAQRCSNNVVYNSEGNIVYSCGRYIIIYKSEYHTQQIFSTHNNEVSSLAIHPNKVFIASGERSKSATLLVWNSQTMQIVFKDTIPNSNSIRQITFSNDGVYLSVLIEDLYNSVCVYNWKEKKLLYSSYVDLKLASASAFLTDGTLVVGGVEYLYFWVKSCEGYTKINGIFGNLISVQATTTMVQVGYSYNVICGTGTGYLLLWNDRSCIKYVKAHESAVNALYSCIHGILSGGDDRRIRMFSKTLEPIVTFDISSFGTNPSLRALCLSSDGASIVFGTMASNIFEVIYFLSTYDNLSN